MSAKEQTPTSSQATNSWRVFSEITSVSIEALNREGMRSSGYNDDLLPHSQWSKYEQEGILK